MNYMGFYHNGRWCTCHTCKHFSCPKNENPCKDCWKGLEKPGRFFYKDAVGYEENPQFVNETIRVHDLKILPRYFVQRKNFELRKNDRDYHVGDIVVLREWSEATGYTGKCFIRTIQYILSGVPEYGLADGYCILALSESAPY